MRSKLICEDVTRSSHEIRKVCKPFGSYGPWSPMKDLVILKHHMHMKTLRISKNAHEIRWPTATASWNRYEDEGWDNMQ